MKKANSMASTEHQPHYSGPAVDRFLRLLTEATRASPSGGPVTYIPPAGADQAEANYNHFVFGQRGSGKSSLLRHLERRLRDEKKAAVWADQEIYAALQYPDVLVSITLEIMQGLRKALLLHDQPSTWRRLADRTRMALGRSPSDNLANQASRSIANLSVLKLAPIDREVEWIQKTGSESHVDLLGKLRIAHVAEIDAGGGKRRTREATSTEVIRSSKEEYLERSLGEFRSVASSIGQVCGGGFVFLDDFYLLRSEDQPRVLGYVHRLLKDTGLWLKIGSIRYSTVTYRTAHAPVGMQLGHDAHEIALDRQFAHYDATKSFLEEIGAQLAEHTEVSWTDLFTSGAQDRLMLASGGVARDYLRLTAGAIHSARNRGPGPKSGTERIIVEDINSAAGLIAPSKLDELGKDAPDEAARLERLVLDLVSFCRDRKSAYFLVDTQGKALSDDIDALQHLRFTHLLTRSETVPDKASQRFDVWLMDVAQLSAQRATQGMDFDGWKERQNRRSRRLIFSPDWVSTSADVRSRPETIAQDGGAEPRLFRDE